MYKSYLFEILNFKIDEISANDYNTTYDVISEMSNRKSKILVKNILKEQEKLSWIGR